ALGRAAHPWRVAGSEARHRYPACAFGLDKPENLCEAIDARDISAECEGDRAQRMTRSESRACACLSPRYLEFRRGSGGHEGAFKKPADRLRARNMIPLCPSIDGPNRLRRKPNTDQRVCVRCRPAVLGLDRFWHG